MTLTGPYKSRSRKVKRSREVKHFAQRSHKWTKIKTQPMAPHSQASPLSF